MAWTPQIIIVNDVKHLVSRVFLYKNYYFNDLVSKTSNNLFYQANNQIKHGKDVGAWKVKTRAENAY